MVYLQEQKYASLVVLSRLTESCLSPVKSHQYYELYQRVVRVYGLIFRQDDQYFHEPEGRVEILIFEIKYEGVYSRNTLV